MSCYFCQSDEHFSKSCKIYETDEARKKILVANKCCPICTGIPKDGYNYWGNSCSYCDQKSCYLCFSRCHYTEECPDPPKVSFLPNIDRVMLSRYMKFLSIEEQYSLFFTYPIIFNSIKLKLITVKFEKDSSLPRNDKLSDLDMYIAYHTSIRWNLYCPTLTSNFHSTVFRIKSIELICSSISSPGFLHLLSLKTKIIKCCSKTFVNFKPKLKLHEILEKAPNLEKIDIHQTDVEIGNSWPEDLLRFKHTQKLQNIHLSITKFNFKIEKLAELIKTKTVNIYLYIISSDQFFNKKEIFNKVKNKLSNFFKPVHYPTPPVLSVLLPKRKSNQNFVSKYFSLKDL